MYLFIDTISNPCYLALFDEKRNIVDSLNWPGQRKEFDTLIETIDTLIKKNNISYKQLSGISSITGPGSFTGTRVTTLVINAIAYAFGTKLYPLSVGDFFHLQKSPLPWITPITKKEVLLWITDVPNAHKLTPIMELDDREYSSVTTVDFDMPKSTIRKAKDYAAVIAWLSLSTAVQRMQSIYAKEPNITLKSAHAFY